jgi:hypothetical protein
LLSIAGITALVWSIIEAPTRGWTDGRIVTGFAAAAVLLAAFVTWELRTAEPMLPVRFFTSMRLTAASLAISIAFFGLIGSYFLLTQYLQFVHHQDPFQAGLRTLPFAAAVLVTAPLSAGLVQRFGTKAVVATGMATMASGALIGTTLDVGSGDAPLLLALLVLGIGMGLATAPATESVMGSLPRAHAGVGSAINDTLRELGIALGVAVIGSVAASVYRDRLDHALASGGVALSPTDAHAAHESIGGALAVAGRSPAGASVADAARTAFVDGFRTGWWVAAATMLLSAAVALVFLPARAAHDEDSSMPEAVSDAERSAA